MGSISRNYPQLADAARAVLDGNRHMGISTWEQRAFNFVCPSNVTYPFQWLWDSSFHAIVLSALDVSLARQEMLCLLQAAQPDGFIPHMILWERERYGAQIATYNIAMLNDYLTAISQPPLIAQAVERVYNAAPDPLFLNNVLPFVERYYQWWQRERDPERNGLISIIQPDESGMDASPKYDVLIKMETYDPPGLQIAMDRLFAAYAPLRWSMSALLASDIFRVEDVMMNSVYAQGLHALARLCESANAPERAAQYRAQAAQVTRALVNRSYNPKTGLFYDLMGQAEIPAAVNTITCLLPLILPDLDAAIAARLVEEHLHNPAEYWLPYPLPCVAANEPTFDPESRTQLLWRGQTWLNMNWWLCGGLRLHGYDTIADELADRTCRLVLEKGFREYYNPYTGEPGGAPQFGWSTLALDM